MQYPYKFETKLIILMGLEPWYSGLGILSFATEVIKGIET